MLNYAFNSVVVNTHLNLYADTWLIFNIYTILIYTYLHMYYIDMYIYMYIYIYIYIYIYRHIVGLTQSKHIIVIVIKSIDYCSHYLNN